MWQTSIVNLVNSCLLWNICRLSSSGDTDEQLPNTRCPPIAPEKVGWCPSCCPGCCHVFAAAALSHFYVTSARWWQSGPPRAGWLYTDRVCHGNDTVRVVVRSEMFHNYYLNGRARYFTRRMEYRTVSCGQCWLTGDCGKSTLWQERYQGELHSLIP